MNAYVEGVAQSIVRYARVRRKKKGWDVLFLLVSENVALLESILRGEARMKDVSEGCKYVPCQFETNSHPLVCVRVCVPLSFDFLKRAYNNLDRGSIHVAKDLLFHANINRSPTSYLLNPQSERDEYAGQGDTDKTMLQMKFTRSDGQPVGLLNWFAVHGTSMNASNLVRTFSFVQNIFLLFLRGVQF
jgi:hypothetical protein